MVIQYARPATRTARGAAVLSDKCKSKQSPWGEYLTSDKWPLINYIPELP